MLGHSGHRCLHGKPLKKCEGSFYIRLQNTCTCVGASTLRNDAHAMSPNYDKIGIAGGDDSMMAVLDGADARWGDIRWGQAKWGSFSWSKVSWSNAMWSNLE